jgi:hypothetical protein
MAFHDLTTSSTPPRNLRTLLGQGLKFIPTPYRTSRPSDLLQDRMGVTNIERSLRLACFFLAHPPSRNSYNPRMCVTSDWTPPEKYFPKILSRRLLQFKIRLHRLFEKPTRVISNLSLPHRYALQYLRSQNDYLVVHCDKNLGPALIERDKYIRLAVSDHLADETTYQALTAEQAARCQLRNASAFQDWLLSYRDFLLTDEFTYLQEYVKGVEDPFPFFYLLMKVHKKPLKTRPIVSYSGSYFYGLGVWVDHYLKQAAVTLRSYLKSSFELRAQLHTLVLPPGRRYRLFTADATSMYTNIDTAAACAAIHRYIEDRPTLFPAIPIHALTAAIEMIMTRNVFQFGDTFWKQLNGTAMGAPPAPSYATLSFGTHEETLLDEFDAQLAYYRRYIDDVLGVWCCHPDPIQDDILWTQFGARLNSWHGLQWIVSERTNVVDFLDLTLTLHETSISCTLFEKLQNLHLYLPPRSAHPPGMLFGVIAGNIYRARSLCSDKLDADEKIRAFWRHLLARGYSASSLRPLFDKALNSVVPFLDRPPPAISVQDSERLWLFKVRYHPQDPPSSAIRQAWEATVASPPLSKPLHQVDVSFKTLGHRRFLVCYNRPPNLGNLLSYRKIQPTSGPPVSSFL